MDIRRPPYLRSQSENSSTATIIASSYPHLRALDDFDHNRRGANTIVGPRRPPRNPARTHTTTPPVSSSSRPSRQSTSSGIVASQSFLSKPSSNTASTSGSAAAPAPGIQKSHSKPNSNFSSKSSLEHHADHQTANNLKFSTADRTILEELKRNISAREAQFIVKGPLTNHSGRKHHPFNKEDVPYPRSYDREVLDLDVWETLFYHQICESLTWHVFEDPPTKVLDIGCGTGSWILDCARIWRTCHFVGMDLVPLQPDLQQVGSSDLAQRVTWIQGNFLENLPFPNEEFDFVHIKRISLGVPEDKWDSLFEEILRVMKPGAAFEMIEEDLMFPGGAIHSTIMPVKPQPSEVHRASISLSSKSTPLRHPLSVSTGSLTDLQLSSPYSSNPYAKLNYVTGANSSISGSAPPKRPLSTSNNGTASPFLLRTLPKPPVNPRDHSMLEMIYNEMNAARFVNLSPLSLLPNLLGLYFKDLRTHPPVIFTFPPIPVVEQSRSSDPDPDPDPDEDAQDAIRPSPLSAGTGHTARGRSMSNASNISSRLTGSPTPSSARTAYFEGLPDHWINMRQIDSPAADADRSCSEIDPPRGTHDMFTPRPHNPAHDVRFRLPNTTMNIDLRSLNLHLALRVTEILACSETMWEWVLDYQEQARNKKIIQETKTRARSRSIGPVRPPSRDQPLEPESSEVRLKTALTELTRETYEDMLRRFYLDMQDCMALPAVLHERFGWTTFPASPSAERGTFETQCEKYQQWEAEQHQRNNFKFLSGEVPRQRADKPVVSPSDSIFNSSAIVDGLPASHMNGRSSVSSALAKTKHGSRGVPPIAPSRRLSRSLRVFVAWKGV
ncbi:MAG: hypothetical protein NXY57DRAFT_894439 [Lentinula lateritia]|nr:MAG: hypothetical protein NXY57DRAFT_894439 [Lentinula lateritia]